MGRLQGIASKGINYALNTLLIRISIRAETNSPEFLHRTFVEVEQIANGLLRLDHQIVYGRRGTGKTHAFANLAVELDEDGDLPVYIDLRKVGSNNGLYADPQQNIGLRATQLLIDIVESIHSQLLAKSIDDDRFEALFPHLDAVADAATEVRVVGPVSLSSEAEQETSDETSGRGSLDLKWEAGVPRPEIGFERSRSTSQKKHSRATIQRSGTELPRVLFGPLGKALESAAESIAPRRIWLLLDEWSSIPIDLQPLLADMLRRVIFTCRGFTVKIGAIERRSQFIARTDPATYLGLELGADTAAALNLDEYLLATEAGAKAQSFFSQLLCKHISVLAEDLKVDLSQLDSKYFVERAFDKGAFAEFVRAVEGVPRDAINIAGSAASTAGQNPIRVSDIKSAARKYYLQDKEKGIAGNSGAQELWDRLQREVVLERNSRTFLLRRNREHTHQAILDLYDARLIHLLRPGLATRNRPGVGYDGYSVDYGSYINMLGEAEVAALWDARARPWAFSGEEALLPDRFDEGVIFVPAKVASQGRRQPR